MEKQESKTYDIEYSGAEWDATVTWWSYGRGSADEIDVALHSEHSTPQNQKTTFRVDDADERDAVFTKNNVDGKSGPGAEALKALSRFGWSCTNYSLDGVKRTQAQHLGPSLEYADSVLADALRYNDALEKFPFLFDMLEVGLTAIAAVNSFCGDAYDDKGRLRPPEDFYRVMGRPDAMRKWARGRASVDPYYYLVMSPLMKVHYDVDLEPEEVAVVHHDDGTRSDALEAMGIIPPDAHVDLGLRSEDFDGDSYGDWFERQFY
jgi:hypothetical protein